MLNKTSTAAMDGNAIGGSIDYRTPSGLDYSDAIGGSIAASWRMESCARDYDESGLGKGAAGEFHAKFGSEHQFGIYASAYYDERHYVNSEVASSSTFKTGDLEIIPGLRFEQTRIRNTDWTMPKDSGGNELAGYFQNVHTTYDVPLPSVFLNYRPGNANAVYRASVWTEHLRADLSVANLTNRLSYWAHVGRNSTAIPDIVDAGPTSLLTVKYTF